MRECHVLTPVQDAGDGKPGYVEDREFSWLFHGWGIEAGKTCAILEAECGKIALVPADCVRILGVESDPVVKSDKPDELEEVWFKSLPLGWEFRYCKSGSVYVKLNHDLVCDRSYMLDDRTQGVYSADGGDDPGALKVWIVKEES